MKLNKKFIKKAKQSFLVLVILFSFNIALAKLTNPINVESIQDFVKVMLEGVITIGVPIVAFAIVYAGFLFVSAEGKSDKIKKAKDALLYSVIGAIILLGAWALAQMISSTVDGLKKDV